MPGVLHKYELFSHNIDTNIRRLEQGFAAQTHPAWSIVNRLPLLFKTWEPFIGSVDFFYVQEGRIIKDKAGAVLIDSVTPIVTFFEDRGYKALVMSYNDTSDTPFQYITAYNPNKFTFLRSYIKYFTKTPETSTKRAGRTLEQIKDNNYGVEYERGCFIVQLRDQQTGEIVFCINVHSDLTDILRKESCRLIAQFVREILRDSPKAKILIAGDFNAFPDLVLQEQLNELTTPAFNGVKLYEATSKLTFQDGAPADFSFIPFVYDPIILDPIVGTKAVNRDREFLALPIVAERKKVINSFYEEKCLSVTGMLDRVFGYGFDNDQGKPMDAALVMSKLYDDETLPGSDCTEPVIKEYVLRNMKKDRPAFASDHQPIYVKAYKRPPI